MASVIRGLLVKISADTAELKTGMQETATVVGETSETIKKAFNGIRESIEALLAVTFFEKLLEKASEASDAMAQMESAVRATGATTGETADSVRELAESLASLNGVSVAAATGMEAIFATFSNISAEILPRASQAALDLAARFKMDLPQAAMILAKALENPVKGMTALQKKGIILNETQKEQVKAFLAVNDIAGAQSVILDKLESSMGGAAAAARDTLGGAMRAVQASIETLAEKIAGGDSGSLRFALELANQLMQEAAKNGGLLSAALNGVAAAGATLISLQIGQKIFALVAALSAGEIAASALATGGLSILVGALVAVGSTSTKTGELVRGLAQQVLKFFEFIINGSLQTAAMVGDVGKAIALATERDWKGARVMVQAAQQDMYRDFVGEYASPVMAEIKKVTDSMAKMNIEANKYKGAAMPVDGADLLGKSKNKGAKEAQALADQLEATQAKIKSILDSQSSSYQSIVDRAKDALAASKAKLMGDESDLTLMKEIEEVQRKAAQSVLQIQKDTAAEVQKIEKAVKAGTLSQVKGAEAVKTEYKQQADAIGKVNKAAGDQIVQLDKLDKAQKAVNSQIGLQKATIDAIEKSTMTLAQKAIAVGNAWRAGTINVGQMRAEIDKLNVESTKQAKEQKDLFDKLDGGLKEQISDMKAKLNGQEKILPLLKMEQEIRAKGSKDQLEQIATLRKEWDELQKITGEYNQHQKLINKVLNSTETQKRKLQEINQLKIDGKITDGEALEASQKITEQLVQQVSLGGMFDTIMNQAFQMMTSGAKNFGKQLDSLLIKMAEMIAKAIILATLTEIFSMGTAGAGASMFMSNLMASLTKLSGLKFADGGRPPTGMASLVGENGPELFIPDGPGTVIPNGAMSGRSAQGSGQGQNVSIQLVQKIPASFSQQTTIGPGGEQQIEITIDRMMTRAAQSGGAFAQLLSQWGVNPQMVTR